MPPGDVNNVVKKKHRGGIVATVRSHSRIVTVGRAQRPAALPPVHINVFRGASEMPMTSKITCRCGRVSLTACGDRFIYLVYESYPSLWRRASATRIFPRHCVFLLVIRKKKKIYIESVIYWVRQCRTNYRAAVTALALLVREDFRWRRERRRCERRGMSCLRLEIFLAIDFFFLINYST